MYVRPNKNGKVIGMDEEQTQYVEEGLVYCPSCNRSDRITLLDIYQAVDRKIFPDSEIPNVYLISLLKCQNCGTVFELERADPRTIKSITEIDFENEFVVYTTENIEKAVQEATKWYTERFEGGLGEPIIQTIGSTIYTTDSRVIIIPEKGD